MTDCTQSTFGFQDIGRRKVTADFSGGYLSSDGGGLLLREVEGRMGLVKRLAGCFVDGRDQRFVEHQLDCLIAQRLFGVTLGYEDLNDHDRLRLDPLHAVLAGNDDVLGQKRSEGAKVFMELPLRGPPQGKKWNRHVDAYVFDSEIGILIESKRLYHGHKWAEIRDDIARLTKDSVKPSLDTLHEQVSEDRQERPEALYALILAENWSENFEKWWLGENPPSPRWDRSDLQDFTCGSRLVYDYEGAEKLSWLYAYRQVM